MSLLLILMVGCALLKELDPLLHPLPPLFPPDPFLPCSDAAAGARSFSCQDVAH
jgi:hypothetical protein